MAALPASSDPQPAISRVYSNIYNTGHSQNHFGDVNYTLTGSVTVSGDALLAFSGPLTISTATQGLLLTSSRLLIDLELGLRDSDLPLRSCISAFRELIRTLLTSSALAAASPDRTGLLAAADLVATVSQAVILFSELEGTVRSALHGRAAAWPLPEDLSESISEAWSTGMERLDAINGILGQYLQVLHW